MKKYLVTGGVLNILLGVMHFAFWELFDWPNSISCLDANNLGIIEVLNIHGAIVILFFGYVSIFNTDELIETKLGKTTLLFIALFYFIRLINEFIFWPNSLETIPMAVFLLIMTLLYLIPFLKSERN